MENLRIIILAAGIGKRMGAKAPKVLYLADAQPLLIKVLETSLKCQPQKIIVVTGFGREAVEAVSREWAEKNNYPSSQLTFAFQAEQLGTGDAVRAALPALENFQGTVAILCGDMPLISHSSLQALLSMHIKESAALSILTYQGPSHNAYGRIVCDTQGRIHKIVEERDCSSQELLINEVNTAVYATENAILAPALAQLSNHSSQKEYYFTDVVAWCHAQGKRISSVTISEASEMQGVNTHWDLNLVSQALKKRRLQTLIEQGVVIQDPASVTIDVSASVAPGAILGPNVQILGTSQIASGVVIEGTAYLKDTIVQEKALIKLGVRAEDAQIGPQAAVGPFAHLRSGTILDAEVKVGNFVETKKSHLAKGAKASHLTYLGDTEVGEHVNIGAGTITCNYDGYHKHKTVIEAGAFIGSNTALVAPVRIGQGAVIGAGSVVAKNVEADALAVSRPELQVHSGWAKKRRENMAAPKKG